MVNSMFKTTGPLDLEQDRAIYVERPERHEIMREIRRPTIESYLALLSPRQTGKTTLLYRIYNELQAIHQPIAFLDISSYRAESAAQCYGHAANKIWAEIRPQLHTASKLRAIARAVDSPIRFREFMLQIARQCRGGRIVILLDEVGAFMSNIGFFETIRSISSSRGHVSEQAFAKYLFVLSGAVDLQDLTTSENSPLANICKPIYLQDFSQRGTELVVGNLQHSAPIDPDVAEYVHNQTQGHPYLTQQLCALIERARPARISVQQVERAISLMRESDENLRYVTRQLTRYPQANDLLRRMIVDRLYVPFSMLNPSVARLFVIGAIQRETITETTQGVPRQRSRCMVRNQLYRRSLYDFYTTMAPIQAKMAEPGTTPAAVTHSLASNGADRHTDKAQAVDPRNYLDFNLHIYPSPARGEPYPMRVDSWAGAGSGQLLFDVRARSLRTLLNRLAKAQNKKEDLHDLGATLWQSILGSQEIERRYIACQAEAGKKKGLRLKLTIEAPDLADLPWEYLYDPESQTFPALSPRTPITRYTNPRQQEPPALAFDLPLRILLVSAAPAGKPQPDVESEQAQIIQAMERLQDMNKVEIEILEHATVRNLQLMLRRSFHVLHYIGHGTYDSDSGNGMLALETETGQEHGVSASQLQYLLRDTTIRLAVFNACMTARGAAGRSIAGELMHAGISATLAMQFAISETSATIFAGEFYRTLADGWPVDAAVAEGRKAVMFATDLTEMDWGIPVLFMRTRDGILFRRESQT